MGLRGFEWVICGAMWQEDAIRYGSDVRKLKKKVAFWKEQVLCGVL